MAIGEPPATAVSTNLSFNVLPETAHLSTSTATVPVATALLTTEELARVAAPNDPEVYKTLPQPHGNSTPTKSTLSSKAASSGRENTIVRVVVDLAVVPEEATEVNAKGFYVEATAAPPVKESTIVPNSYLATETRVVTFPEV